MNVKEAFEQVKQAYKEFDGEKWKAFLEFLSRFHTYSWNNQTLIFMQKPDATLVKGYRAWQKEGRQVVKGEHGIKIFAPLTGKTQNEEGETVSVVKGFRLATVFDISQTEGDDEAIPEVFKGIQGEVEPELIDTFVRTAPVPIVFTGIKSGIRGTYDPKKKCIYINDNGSKHQFKTILHELGHYYHEQVGWEEEDDRQKEFIAESVACAVAAMNNIDTTDYSVTYIKAWLDDYKQFDKLQKKIEKIIKKINKLCDFQKAEVA